LDLLRNPADKGHFGNFGFGNKAAGRECDYDDDVKVGNMIWKDESLVLSEKFRVSADYLDVE
jgi:hypothetical protein